MCHSHCPKKHKCCRQRTSDSNFLEKKSFSQRLKERVKKGLPNEERKRINQLNLVMARTTGKATTEFLEYHLGLAKSLNNLYRTGWNARVIKEQNDTLYSLLSDKNIGVKRGEGKVSIETLLERGEYTSQINGKTTVYKIDSDVADAYKGVRILLDEYYFLKDNQCSDTFSK